MTKVVGGPRSGDGRKPLRKDHYVGSLILLLAVVGAASYGAGYQLVRLGAGIGSASARAAALLLIVAVGLVLLAILFSTLVYRMWAAIQDGHARTSPGKAVGLLFVPFYNFYWSFNVLPGFATDYNAYAERHSLTIRRLGRGIFVAYVTLSIAALVPVIGFIAALPQVVIAPLMVSRICDAVNALVHMDAVAKLHPSQ